MRYRAIDDDQAEFRDRNPERAAPDRGCMYSRRCTDCVWRTCVKELPAKERIRFEGAYRVLRSYLDGTGESRA